MFEEGISVVEITFPFLERSRKKKKRLPFEEGGDEDVDVKVSAKESVSVHSCVHEKENDVLAENAWEIHAKETRHAFHAHRETSSSLP